MSIQETLIKYKTIFISPLDWGLGHATRCVPLIRNLVADNEVILGITSVTRLILDQEFPDLKKIEVEPYNIRYSRSIPLLLKLMTDAPRILGVIQKEHEQVKQIVKDHHVDLIISDNRFGLYHASVESIYVTHQLNIKAGIFSGIANRIHHQYIRKFSNVWVPDFKEHQHSLAGSLSANPGLNNLSYIGPLSRLAVPNDAPEPFDYLILLSGAEPQRSVLEEELCHVFNHTEKKVILVRGTVNSFQVTAKNIRVIDLPDARLLARLICAAETVICRSGYSTLMDMYVLKKKSLVLIPTPGQNEQVYLAEYWKEKHKAKVINQEKISRWKP